MSLRKCIYGMTYCGLCCGVILMIVLLSLSIQNIAQDEWGLEYNKLTCKASSDVKGPGRYAIDPASTFFKYKNTFIPWDLVIDCWTSDLIEITLDVAVQTLYIHEEIPVILSEFGREDDFLPYVGNVLKRTLREVCSNYSALEYYSIRGKIQSDMLSRIENDLPKFGTHISTGGFLQLRNIKLPDDFNNIVIAKQTMQQEILLANNQREQSIIMANTVLSQAQNNATTIINNVELVRRALLFDANQKALGINATYANRLLVYQTAMISLNMNATEYIISILQNKLLSNVNTRVFI